MSVLANAVLLEIREPGAPLDNGDPNPEGGSLLWSGRAAGYLKRVRRSQTVRGDVSGTGTGVSLQIPVRLDIFTILDSAGAPVIATAGADWEASTVLIEDQRTATPVLRRFTVASMEHRQAGTIADSVRLELEAARAA